MSSLISHILFNIFVEWIISDSLEEHDGKASIVAELLPICSLLMKLMLVLRKNGN